MIQIKHIRYSSNINSYKTKSVCIRERIFSFIELYTYSYNYLFDWLDWTCNSITKIIILGGQNTTVLSLVRFSCLNGRVELIHRHGVRQRVICFRPPEIIDSHVRFVDRVVGQKFRNTVKKSYTVRSWIAKEVNNIHVSFRTTADISNCIFYVGIIFLLPVSDKVGPNLKHFHG